MSRTSIALAGIVILSLGTGILVARAAPQGQDPAVLLRAAIETEEVDGNLESAIGQYKQVIKIAGTNRVVAAQALLRLGGCYEKRGPEEARRTYQQLIRDYAEQAKEVAAARLRLAALAPGAEAPGRPGESRLTIRRVPDLDMWARPSPDGKSLAYVGWKSGNLSVLDVATGAQRALTKDGSIGETNRYPMFSAWSPDSRRVACDWTLQGPKETAVELRIVAVDGTTPPETIAVPWARWIRPLEWSPDGTRILCAYGPADGGMSLALVDARAHTMRPVDVNPGGWITQFTSDGETILYSAPADGKAGPHDVFARNLRTGATTSLVQHPAEDLLVGVLPGTEWLLFASDRHGRLDLWAVPFRRGQTEGQPVLVKQGVGRMFPMGFTNDGRYYYATFSATNDVFFVDFDRESGKVVGEARKLTSRWDGSSGQPAFSPDGASLAYLVKRSPMPIPTSEFDSLALQSLRDRAAAPLIVGFDELDLDGVAEPCWLADGSGIVLTGYRNQRQESALYRIDLPSLRKTKIYTAETGRRVTSHDCALGGPFIYARIITRGSTDAKDQADEVVRIDLAGGSERVVFRAPQGQGIGSYAVALSPDGRMLSVVTRLDRYRRTVLVMPVEGGTPRQVHEFRQPSGGGVDHVWTPDGRSILYVEGPVERTMFLRSVRADQATAEPDTIFQWPGQFFGLVFHPNGRQLAFTGRSIPSSMSEVWVVENLREELKLLAPPAPGRLP